jgi:hypothetical protein
VSRWGLYALVPAVVLVVNLLPAFGPPTWALLVYFRLRWSLDIAVLVGMGAIAAGGGRLLLAAATRALADRLPRSRRQRLETLGERARGRRSGSLVALGLFALSPMPSAQLFEAAGLLRFPLLPLTAAFFAGRVVSYSAYLWGAKATEGSHFGSLLVSSFTSPWVVGAELALVTALVWLVGGLARRRA